MNDEANAKTGVAHRASAAQSAAMPQPATMTPTANLVVGIGAAAGGLEAFRTFFSTMPADSGRNLPIKNR